MRIAHSKAFQLTKRKLHFQRIQGASILRMLEDWMGKENFKNGCRVSETALLIQTCVVCLFVCVVFLFSEIFKRLPLHECQNSQLLGISR